MAGTLTACMEGIKTLCDTADVAPQSYAYPAEAITVPCVVVGYPTSVVFDLTYNRGGDTFILPVWLIVGRVDQKESRDALSDALTGVASMKEVLDGAQSFGDVRCTDAEVSEITVSGIAYVGLKVMVEII